MGVKSTKYLSRSAAEDKYVELMLETQKIERLYRMQAVLMKDTLLENELERLNDQAHDGEGFENYIIE